MVGQVRTCWRSLLCKELTSHTCKYNILIFTHSVSILLIRPSASVHDFKKFQSCNQLVHIRSVNHLRKAYLKLLHYISHILRNGRPILHFLLVCFTEQMWIKLIHIRTLFPTDIAFPRIAIRMTTFMKEIQCLVRECNATKHTLQCRGWPFVRRSPACRVRRLFRSRWSDRSICCCCNGL